MFKFGIDWSEQHHNLCIRNDKGAIVSQLELKHTLHTLPSVVLYYRLHPAQVTATTSRAARRALQDEAIREFLGR